MPKNHEHILKSDFARRMGVTPQNVTRWIKEGKLNGCMSKEKKILWPKGRDSVNSLINPLYQKGANERWGKEPPEAIHQKSSVDEKTLKKLQSVARPTKAQADEVMRLAGMAGTGQSTAEAQRWKLNFEAALKKLEFETKKGKLIEAEAIIRECFAIGQALREGLEGISERCAALVAFEPDQHQCREILYHEHNLLLTDICDRLELMG